MNAESRPRSGVFREVLFIPRPLQMCDFLFEVVKRSWVGGTISRRLKIEHNSLLSIHCFTYFFSFTYSVCSLLSVFQVWRHGAKNNCGEGVWVHMLSERGAGHRPACSCHRIKLQPNLPPEPAGGKATSPEGTDPPYYLHFACLCPFFPPMSLSYPRRSG